MAENANPTGEGNLVEVIPNPVGKSRFSLLARAGGLRPYSPTLQGAGFYRPLTTGFRIR